MTTMHYEELIELGFNKNEAKVYLSLARFGKAVATDIIKQTKFHKNIVYDNLEKLIDKGLVSYVIEDGIRHFKIAPPDMLVQMFEEKKVEMEKKKDKAQRIAKEISKSMKVLKHKQEATIYRGIKGIKLFYNQAIEKGIDYVSFGAPPESINIVGEAFWINLNRRLAENNIKARLIFNESIRKHGEMIKKGFPKTIKIRYFKEDFEPLTETNIQGDRVAIMVWTEEPLLFLIQDKYVADSYLKFFNDMWKNSKK